jgi:hypothetical protein
MAGKQTPLITLTTDFGTRDPYVAAMKGVIYSIQRKLCVVDLSHEIPPQNVLEGALFLAGAVRHFPKGTIHVAVVDPGVGTERHPIALRAGEQIIVCPDNGLATLFLRENHLEEARIITNARFMATVISPTFHGRDVFAPAAAHLACGTPFAEVGKDLDTILTLDIPGPQGDTIHGITGKIMHVDRFGNCITNIHQSTLKGAAPVNIRVGRHRLHGIRRTYGDVALGKAVALFGSAGYLEIAVNGGNANAALSLGKGDDVTISF